MRFLGLPLGDALVVCAGEYYDFILNLHNGLKELALQPGQFPQGFQLYMDFHWGLEQAMAMVAQKAVPAARQSAAMGSLMFSMAEQKWIKKHGSLPALTQAPAAIPASRVATTLDHQDDSAAKQAASRHYEFSQFPKLGQPLGNCAWKGAWVHLGCAGWS